MRLLLDLGNTRLKWVLQQEKTWLAQGVVNWQEDITTLLSKAWQVLPVPHHIFAASVVDEERELQLQQIIQASWPRAIQWVRTPVEACGIHNAYTEPKRLGIDRFLAMVAAYATFQSSCVLAGVGTAMTLDAFDAEGHHLGGWIAPGPQLMQQAVHNGTARVQAAEGGRLMDAAVNTVDGLYSGCWHAAAALIERFVQRMTPRLGGRPRLILGGGDAAQLLPLVAYPAELSNDGVLHGLMLWANTYGAEKTFA